MLIYPNLVRGVDGVVIENPKPLLVDWEMATRVDAPEEALRQRSRTVSCNMFVVRISCVRTDV